MRREQDLGISGLKRLIASEKTLSPPNTPVLKATLESQDYASGNPTVGILICHRGVEQTVQIQREGSLIVHFARIGS